MISSDNKCYILHLLLMSLTHVYRYKNTEALFNVGLYVHCILIHITSKPFSDK